MIDLLNITSAGVGVVCVVAMFKLNTQLTEILNSHNKVLNDIRIQMANMQKDITTLTKRKSKRN